MNEALPLAMTCGDPSGIGPELTLQAWLRTREDPDANSFFVVTDPGHLTHLARQLDWPVAIVETNPENAPALFATALPVVPVGGSVSGCPGQPAASDAAITLASIERCVEYVINSEAAAVVTNPISKEVLHRAGFPHPGHTEFLAELAYRHTGVYQRPVMMLWSPELAVVPTTIHIPLVEVPARLTKALLIETARIVAQDLKTRFGLERPRLAFTGLNPHAGEGGDMGREEIEIIRPALAELAGEFDVSGPHPADTLFHAKARRTYDAVIAMYHDQALIPIKTLAFDSAVNVTLGLPFVRTSPDHGTAFDIAGKGIASCESLLAALKLARQLVPTPNPVTSCPVS